MARRGLVTLVTLLLSSLVVASAHAATHATITKAIGKRLTGRVVVKGTLSCDLRAREPWEQEHPEFYPPECEPEGGEPYGALESAWVYTNAYGERCGKPGGYLGADTDAPSGATIYEFKVVGHVDFAREGVPTVACLTQTEYTTQKNPECTRIFDPSICATESGPEYWHVISRVRIKWVGPRPCVVPSLWNKTLKAAKRRARKSRCAIGQVTKRRGATARTGRIARQRPKAGKTLRPWTKVAVTLR